MRNVPPDKYNVAWFKLAECVSRGEKERALGVYRLLAHSLHDSGFARQLQGDIFVAFNDAPGALEHYQAAADLYQKDGRFTQAAAVYEHLLTLVPTQLSYVEKLVQLYGCAHNRTKMVSHATHLYTVLIDQQQYEEAIKVVDGLHVLLSTVEVCAVRQQLVALLLTKESVASALIIDQGKKIITHMLYTDDAHVLQRFLATLSAFNTEIYQELCTFVSEKR